MRTVRAPWAAPVAAAALGAATVGLGLADLFLGFAARRQAGTVIASAAVIVPGVVVGTLLAARRPRNPIGWMLLGFWLFLAVPSGI